MATKRIGISRDLIIHPGETISDVLEDRGITQAELASQTGVTPAYISSVITGKKGISAKFAFALEYALGVPKTFWMNLQTNYEAELLEADELQTITDEERTARDALKDVVKHLRAKGLLPTGETKDESILSLRKALKISNIANLKDIAPTGTFRMAKRPANPYVLGAWVRMCQISAEKGNVSTKFEKDKVDELVSKVKAVMTSSPTDMQGELKELLGQYGIDFSIMQNFAGAPVQGYIALKDDETYQMVLTIRGSYADIFWFSLFHEIGHIVNGDVRKASKFIDYGSDEEKERSADLFAQDKLIDSEAYQRFISVKHFDIETINNFAKEQKIMPYIVIGRMQKEKVIGYRQFSDYKLRYKWTLV
jgi:HTH-type transcriptional regulator / antitoxin HigA